MLHRTGRCDFTGWKPVPRNLANTGCPIEKEGNFSDKKVRFYGQNGDYCIIFKKHLTKLDIGHTII
jgi:hypothetical protein